LASPILSLVVPFNRKAKLVVAFIPEEREHILYTLDALIKNVKFKTISE
jgi:hypothetical protein